MTSYIMYNILKPSVFWKISARGEARMSFIRLWKNYMPNEKFPTCGNFSSSKSVLLNKISKD